MVVDQVRTCKGEVVTVVHWCPTMDTYRCGSTGAPGTGQLTEGAMQAALWSRFLGKSAVVRSSRPICSINSRGRECNEHRRPSVPPQSIPKIWRTNSTIGRGCFSWEFCTFFNLHVWTYLLPETVGLVGYFLVYYVGKLNQIGETPQAQITLLFFEEFLLFMLVWQNETWFFVFGFSFACHVWMSTTAVIYFASEQRQRKFDVSGSVCSGRKSIWVWCLF